VQGSTIGGETGIQRPAWRRLIGFNLLGGLVLAGIGFVLGWLLGTLISNLAGAHATDAGAANWFIDQSDENDIALLLAYTFGLVGWLGGLGFLNYPLARIAGRPPSIPPEDTGTGMGRYFRMNTNHKVVGIQYLVVVLALFFIGGLNAMLIRAELLQPTPWLWQPDRYLTLVGLHGTMMLMIMSAGVLGPFGNYLVPIMVGSRGMAFPRIESLSFWLTPAAGVVLLSTLFLGGYQTGWTGYAPLADQSRLGMDAYLVAFTLIGLSMVLVGINLITTIVNMRAPGMTWTRLPIFCWGVLSTGILMVLSPLTFAAALFMVALDRTSATNFFISAVGGSPYLYENLFWFFGHPEVYILALPGFGIVLELMTVFARKPLFGYRLAVAAMLGVAILSFMVWQHHLFVSGINATLRPFYMLTTELISIPTGFVFLVAIGTLWRGKIQLAVPMLFCLAFLFNFLIGGVSGVFVSDVPSDVSLHGSYFVLAHFHYTIMGGLVFAFFAGIYYWFPKMTGYLLNDRLAKVHFWGMFLGFNGTFLPLFAAGLLDMPRRVITYNVDLLGLNVFASLSAFVLGLSMLVFLFNFVHSWVVARVPAVGNLWGSRSVEWMLPSPPPVTTWEASPVFVSGPYEYGVAGAPAMANLAGQGSNP
jgi:cytochrome c oxidase subunit I